MLRLFQVIEGRFLPLEQEVPPTARVSELCSAVEVVSGQVAESQVLMTSNGQQMDPHNIIGAYSVGTDNKPIFVFFLSHLHSVSFPSIPSLITPRPDLQKQLQLLTQRPSPTHFQRQVALAKLLGERSVELGGLCQRLGHELGLQQAGWTAVLSNCHSIVRTYRKHQQLFSRMVITFNASKPRYLSLLTEFPSQLKLLQSLPLPSTDTAMTSSLYDWISTHDEKNSLVDLSTECKKALAQADGEHIQAALATSEEILGDTDLASLEAPPPVDNIRVQELQGKAEETSKIQSSLAENVQSTSQRALRSGDAGTVAALVQSHQQTLALMSQQNKQLEQWAEELEAAKSTLSQHIHGKLRSVVELQMTISESNSQLLLFHEHIKLATKRFEVLEQVYSVPVVLGSVLGEVARRRGFRSALEQRAHEVSSLLRQAREEEKHLRRQFHSTHGGHFIATLFPELQSRAPEATVQLSHSSEDGLEHAPSEQVMARIRELLPSEFCPPAVPAPLLDSCTNSPRTPLADSAVQTEPPVGRTDSSEEQLSGDGEASEGARFQPAEKTCQVDAERAQWEAERRELLERSTGLAGELQQCKDEYKVVEAECAAIRAEATAAAISKADEAVARLQEQLQLEREQMAGLRQQLKAERDEGIGLRQQLKAERDEVAGLKEQLKANKYEVVGLRQQLKEGDEVAGLRQQLQAERDEVVGLRQQLKESDAKLVQLQGLLEDEREKLALQVEDCTAENIELKQQLKESRDEAVSLRTQLESSAAEAHTLRQKCEAGSAELTTLKGQAANSTMELQQRCTDLEDECSRQNARHQQAQVALSNSKAQLEQAETQAREVSWQLTEALDKLKERETELQAVRNELLEHKGCTVGLDDQLLRERERAAGLEDQLSQERERAAGLEDQLSQERERAAGLEDQLSQERERIVVLEQQLSVERDGYMKQSMELEREVKELRRGIDETTFPLSGSHSPRKSSSVAMVTSEEKVAISNLQVGDLAFFLTDQYRNYLALSADGKIYYLNQACVPTFTQDLSDKITQLQLRRKFLLGRITARLLVEVRKEGNRLRVPVGSRLYKVDAVEVTV